MGTNYYLLRFTKAQESPEYLHLGKQSAGWKFLLHPLPETCVTWRGMKACIRQETADGAVIKDEYGNTVTYAEFVELVETSTHHPEALSHSLRYWREDDSFQDSEGFDFSPGRWS
jgi:hypothetical protein